MTCVVGIEHKDGSGVTIGVDSIGLAGWNVTLREDTKVFRNWDMLFGFAGSFRGGQLLQYSLVIPPFKDGQDEMDFLVNDFVSAVRRCFDANGFSMRKQDVESFDAKFLIGFRTKLYLFDSDYQVGRSRTGYGAIGAGSQEACGSLHTTSAANSLSPKRRCELALEAAQAHNAAVRAPFMFQHMGPPRVLDISSPLA